MISRDALADHLRVDRYGDFVLTDAIRPAPHLPVVPREGFRLDVFREPAAGLEVPVIAVLGNHDYQSDRQDEITGLLREAGIFVLEGSGVVVSVPGGRLGVAGTKGFGAGFPGRCGSEFGEPEMKAFVRHSRHLAAGL